MAPSCVLLPEAPFGLRNVVLLPQVPALSMEANLLLSVLICSFSWVHTALILGSASSLRGLRRLWFTDATVILPTSLATVAADHTHAGAQATLEAAASAHPGQGWSSERGVLDEKAKGPIFASRPSPFSVMF